MKIFKSISKRHFFILLIIFFLIIISRRYELSFQISSYINSVINSKIDTTILYNNSLTKKIINIFYLKEENDKLQKKIESLENIEIKYRLLLNENIKLKELLNFIPDEKYKYITARIISSAPGTYVRSGIINGGKKQGIVKDQIVFNKYGLIGRIINVSEESSRILFINDYNSRIPVITSDSNERGILVGDNSDLLQLTYLPKNSHIKVGELLTTSGDGQYYPAGFAVAEIVSINGENIKARPFLDLKSLEFVIILLKDDLDY